MLSPSDKSQKRPLNLEAIVGEQLSSVEFVQDYVQLHFDGPTITLFVWPIIKLHDKTVNFGQLGYRDELCGRIGHKVLVASLRDGDALILTFDDSTSLHTSLRPEDNTGPEVGYFRASADPGAPLEDF
jgi:hypothetical protein